MKRRALLLAVLLGCALAPAAAAQENPGIRDTTAVLRRADRRAVVIRYPSELATGNPIATGNFKLTDVTANAPVTLARMSTVDKARCPGVELGDLLCIELASGDSLFDGHVYVLVMDSVPLATGTEPPGVKVLPAVYGKITHEVPVLQGARTLQWVIIDYSREFRSASEVIPRIQVNGDPVAIVNDSARCTRGNLDFACHIDRVLHNGDVVTAQLVDARTGEVVEDDIPSFTVKRKPPEDPDDASLVLDFAYTRQHGTPSGAVTGTLRSCRLSDAVAICPTWYFGGLSKSYEVTIHPYADVRLDLADNGGGYWTVGPQVQAYLYDVSPLQLMDLRLTPRREASQDGSVTNWIVADVDARLYVKPLYTGVLGREREDRPSPTYRIIPRLGYEWGLTGNGQDSVRAERNNPSRGKFGVEARLNWSENALGFAPEGLTLKGDWMLYLLRSNPDFEDPIPSAPQLWSASLTLNVARNFGVTVSRRGGREPPLFSSRNVLEVGATYIR